MRRVVKIMTEEAWEKSLGSGRVFVSSSKNDVRDGFIHCASAEQVTGSLTRWYSDQARVVIVEIDTDRSAADVRWEPNAEGELWPHIYGSITPEGVAGARMAIRQESGTFRLGADLDGG